MSGWICCDDVALDVETLLKTAAVAVVAVAVAAELNVMFADVK